MTKRAVIYARYSTDLQREASIDDQIRVCSERATREGWTVVGTYADRAASGANLANRAGMRSLIDDARAKKFDIVISEALDRLSRDQEDVAAIYKRLCHCDVLIFTLAEGKVDELHIGFKGTMNALFLKDLASKIRRGQRGRIAAGFAAGGITYGYQVVRGFDQNGDLIRGKRVVKELEAATVRHIYEAYANGMSPRRIAADLNARGVPAPRGGQWNASTINGHRARRNGILQNDLYKGSLVYNRVRMVKDPDSGKRISRTNPKSEWVTIEVQDLRIISDELWDKVQAKKASYSSQPAHKSRRAKRLLSGLLTCGECGGSFTIVRPGKYGCATHREKGSCRNGRQISADQIERRVLAGVKRHLSDPRLLSEFIREFQIELNRLKAATAEAGSTSEKSLDQLKQKIERIVSAIAEGTDTPSLRDALLRLEAEKTTVQKALAGSKNRVSVEPSRNLEALFRKKVAGLEKTLSSNPIVMSQAASIFRTLIDRIVLHPGPRPGIMSIEVHGEPSALFLMAGGEKAGTPDGMIKVVAEEGFEPPTHGL